VRDVSDLSSAEKTRGLRHPEPDLANYDNIARSPALRDESQGRREACFMVCKRTVCQSIQRTGLRVSLDLLVPCLGVKLRKPIAKGSKFIRA
jgi:hypothetical protein